jgi:hypothetical protein
VHPGWLDSPMCQSTAPRGTAARHHGSGAAALRAAAVTASRLHTCDFGANLFGAHQSLRSPGGVEKSRGSGHRSQGTPASHEQGRLVAGICSELCGGCSSHSKPQQGYSSPSTAPVAWSNPHGMLTGACDRTCPPDRPCKACPSVRQTRA